MHKSGFVSCVKQSVVATIQIGVLLASGFVRLPWIEAGASLLLRHPAFFFVPIAVGLMSLGELLRTSGIVLLIIMVASAGIDILVKRSEHLSQRLANQRVIVDNQDFHLHSSLSAVDSCAFLHL